MQLNKNINGKTRLLGLIGNPVQHTKSPFIHNTLFDYFGINAVYVPINVENEELEPAIEGLKAMKFLGFNVTVPHKKSIIKHLDDITTEAILMGAVNTVKNIDGRLVGYNTDAEGFIRDFKEGFNTNFRNKRVLMLGAGGTGRALAVKLASEGITQLVIANRTLENANDIAELVNNNVDNVVRSISPGDSSFDDVFKTSDVIINVTPVGMSTVDKGLPFGRQYSFKPEQLVYDVIYSPRKTPLLDNAERAGCKIRNGFGMLVNQGILAFEIWSGKTVPKEFSSELLKEMDKLEEF